MAPRRDPLTGRSSLCHADTAVKLPLEQPPRHLARVGVTPPPRHLARVGVTPPHPAMVNRISIDGGSRCCLLGIAPPQRGMVEGSASPAESRRPLGDCTPQRGMVDGSASPAESRRPPGDCTPHRGGGG